MQLLTQTKNVDFPIMQHAKDSKMRLERIRSLLKTAVDSLEPESIVTAHEEARLIHLALADIVSLSPELEASTQRLASAFQRYFEFSVSLSHELIIKGEKQASLDSMNPQLNEMLEYLQIVTQAMDILQKQSEMRFYDVFDSADAAAAELEMVGVITLCVTLFLGGCIYWVLRVNIINPINVLMTSTHQVSQGDLNTEVKINNRDELGELAKAFNCMTRSLRDSYQVLQQRNDELQRATIAKSTFLANMSHEIRTPLSAIIGFSEELLENDMTESQKVSALNTIIRSGTHLKNVINDILDLSKIEAEKLQVDIEDVDLFGLIDEVAAMVSQQTQSKGLRLDIRHQFPLPKTIATDPLRLKQILINLCGNAAKFTDFGGITILLSYAQDTRKLRFIIKDTGIGIANDQLDKVFEVFQQADSSPNRRFGGTGLGLPLSRKLAQMLGGDISLHSLLGIGSEFTISIDAGDVSGTTLVSELARHSPPALGALSGGITTARSGGVTATQRSAIPTAQSDECPTTPTTRPPTDPVSGSTRSGRVKALLAEDTPDNQRLFTLLLKRSAIDLVIVENGAKALEEATQRPYDLILMDIQMPIMNGLEATQKLRSAGFTNPIIAITANTMQQDLLNYQSVGFDAVVAKPVSKKMFLDTLYALVPLANPDAAQVPATSVPVNENSMHTPTVEAVATDNLNLKLLSSAIQGLSTLYNNLMDANRPSAASTVSPPLVANPAATALAWREQEPTQQSSGPVFSRLYEDDPELVSILEKYILDLRHSIDKINAAFDNQDWTDLISQMHKLKGTGGAFGFPELSEMAKEIHLSLLDGNTDPVPEKLGELSAYCERILDGYEIIERKFNSIKVQMF